MVKKLWLYRLKTSNFGNSSWSPFAGSVSHGGAQHVGPGLLQWFSANLRRKLYVDFAVKIQQAHILSVKRTVYPKVSRQVKVFLSGAWECWTRNDWQYLSKQVDIVRFLQLLQAGIGKNVLTERTLPDRTEWSTHQFFGVHFLHIFCAGSF